MNIFNIIIAQLLYYYIHIYLKYISRIHLLFHNEIIILSAIVSEITIKKT
jgi:hypothetical protein